MSVWSASVCKGESRRARAGARERARERARKRARERARGEYPQLLDVEQPFHRLGFTEHLKCWAERKLPVHVILVVARILLGITPLRRLLRELLLCVLLVRKDLSTLLDVVKWEISMHRGLRQIY